jgi:serine/threonine protein kinase
LTDTHRSSDPNSSPSSLSTYRSPEKVEEDFKFGKQLGEGAYAVVKLAKRRQDGKNYAVKIYDKNKLVDEHRRTSVCREVMLMQKMKHQSIVEFKEAFETNANVFVVMEHVEGQSLHDYLK